MRTMDEDMATWELGRTERWLQVIIWDSRGETQC